MRHRLLIWTIALLPFFLVACEEEQPGWVMSEEEMVPVIKDLHLAYAGVDVTIRNPKNRPMKYQEMNELVIEKHNLDRQKFYDSYEYYQNEPALMDSIYQKVVNELNEELLTGPGANPGPNQGGPPNGQ